MLCANHGSGQSMDCASQSMDPCFARAIHGWYGLKCGPDRTARTSSRDHLPAARGKFAHSAPRRAENFKLLTIMTSQFHMH